MPFSHGSSKLEYFVSEKSGFVVVSFVGVMTKLTAPTIDKCAEDVLRSAGNKIILSFHDVTQLEPGALPALIRLQKAGRDKPGDVRVCFLKPAYMRYLLDAGAIRPQEICDSLMRALQTLGPAADKKAA